MNNSYSIPSTNLIEIANHFGTPVYVYDSAKIISQYHRLKNSFPGDHVRIKYACKALNNLNVLRLLKNEGSGLYCYLTILTHSVN